MDLNPNSKTVQHGFGFGLIIYRLTFLELFLSAPTKECSLAHATRPDEQGFTLEETAVHSLTGKTSNANGSLLPRPRIDPEKNGTNIL